MQIVIDIDDDLYTRLFDNGGGSVTDMKRTCAAVRKGVIIPKSHGRLIDADEFSNGLKEADIKLTDAPTIIEADNAER